MKTLTEQYRSVKEGKGPKDVFLKEAKRRFPNLVTNAATFKEASTILKQRGIISETFVGSQMIGNPLERKKEGFENAFANFIAEAEAKAEEKKVSKEVEEKAEKNHNYSDKKDPNNMIYGQIQMGVYYEAKQEKNADKTLEEIKDIVYKNLDKDSIYYTKNGQFGVDAGYTDEAPSLGATEEPKGEHKSSGYGKLKEHSISTIGGIVTDNVFSSKDYKSFFGLNEELPADSEETAANVEAAKEAAKELADELERADDALEENEAPLEAMVSIDDMVAKAEEMAREMEERGDEVSIDMIVDKVLSELRTDIKNALEASLNLDTSDK